MFRQRCQSCHSDEPGNHVVVGPDLYGVVGRKAGSTEFRYSPALKQSGLVWTHDALAKFLASPSKAVPGTYMSVSIASEAQRDAVIAYLATTGR